MPRNARPGLLAILNTLVILTGLTLVSTLSLVSVSASASRDESVVRRLPDRVAPTGLTGQEAASVAARVTDLKREQNPALAEPKPVPTPDNDVYWGVSIKDALGGKVALDFPAIKARVWFNWQFDGMDWRIESSQSSADALRAAIASPSYLANQFGSLQAVPIPAP